MTEAKMVRDPVSSGVSAGTIRASFQRRRYGGAEFCDGILVEQPTGRALFDVYTCHVCTAHVLRVRRAISETAAADIVRRWRKIIIDHDDDDDQEAQFWIDANGVGSKEVTDG